MGGVPVDLGIVKDKEATLKGAVEAALEQCDVLVTSGGVSMGEADLLKPILEVPYACVECNHIFLGVRRTHPVVGFLAVWSHNRSLFFVLPLVSPLSL